jgi:fibro-slime domain-containing protein
VYINGELVIDLGGVHAATEQYIDLNRLGLTNGNNCSLDFFFAERHRTQSNFRIVTNIYLESDTTPSVSSIFD